MRVDDRLLEVRVADVRPAPGVEVELEAVRRRRGVLRGHIVDRAVAVEQEQAARLVRSLRARVFRDLRTDACGHYHHSVRSIAVSTSSVFQKSALRYFQPASARMHTTTPSSSSSASFRATCTTA